MSHATPAATGSVGDPFATTEIATREKLEGIFNDIKSHPLYDHEIYGCLNCGICTATCPLGIDVLPRQLMRFGLLGLDDEVRRHEETVFSCLLCRACEASCPAGVHITDNIRNHGQLPAGSLEALPHEVAGGRHPGVS